MRNDRKTYLYYPRVQIESPVVKQLEKTDKMIGRIATCIGVLGIGGYFLCKKVKELSDAVARLSKDCKKMKEETEK